jgi:hypothetical protein
MYHEIPFISGKKKIPLISGKSCGKFKAGRYLFLKSSLTERLKKRL